MVTFTIVTPSFNQLEFLKRCVASVADQVAPEAQRSEIGDQKSANLSSDFCPLPSESGSPIRVHHHVQDGGSSDETVEWLDRYAQKLKELSLATRYPPLATPAYTFSYSSEPDAGMYDALNKGIAFVSGGQRSETRGQFTPPGNQQRSIGNCDDEIIAWLNCDEQYLPDALRRVSQYFSSHPKTDVVCGDVLLVSPEGTLLTYRKNPPLRRAYVLADHLYVHSAAMFFQAGLFRSGIRFDTVWKAVGDCELIVRLLGRGGHSAQVREYLAACTMTGKNLSRQAAGVEELNAFRKTAPLKYRLGRPVWNILRHFEKMIRGGYAQSLPLEYELYTEHSNVRKFFSAQEASCRFQWGVHE